MNQSLSLLVQNLPTNTKVLTFSKMSKETINKSFKTKITERNKSRSKKKTNLSDPETLNVEPIESQCYNWKKRRVSYPMISLDQKDQRSIHDEDFCKFYQLNVYMKSRMTTYILGDEDYEVR